jgi:hypothetical protein
LILNELVKGIGEGDVVALKTGLQIPLGAFERFSAGKSEREIFRCKIKLGKYPAMFSHIVQWLSFLLNETIFCNTVHLLKILNRGCATGLTFITGKLRGPSGKLASEYVGL